VSAADDDNSNADDLYFDWSLLDKVEADWQGMGKIR